ncbi:FapA family protein [Bacillus smithii]|uniref:FapA family protein n=1 Tax=Bacillus smithii TaxID=1479 RepID=UPI0030C92AF3
MRSVVSKGKNIEEAIQLGLKLLDTKKEEVDIEIIQHETKGFFGIGARKAIVKLTKVDASAKNRKENDRAESEGNDKKIKSEMLMDIISETASSEDENETHPVANELDKEGKVWVKSGRLFFTTTPTFYPTLTIGKGIKLYKNDELVQDKNIVLSETDRYEVKCENEVQDTKWNISIDKLKLKALLHVEPGYQITRRIPDIEPSKHIELIAEELKEIQNTLSFAEVIEELASLGVIYGINKDQILKAIESRQPDTFEIATGKKATRGHDGWIEPKVPLTMQNGLKEDEDGKVNYREIRAIPTAERGEVIAVIHPPFPGQPGITITNEPLPPKPSYPIKLRAGKGVVVVDDKIVAMESGRPHIEQRGQLVKVEILPKITHSGNVDLSSGNIRFVGDVDILGDVDVRMTVEAAGAIFVQKNVNMATLTAAGAIVVNGNVIGSKLSAGKHNRLIAELGQLLEEMHVQVKGMIEVITQLIHSPAFKSSDLQRGGMQPLIRILLEKKFKNLPPLAKKYVDLVQKEEKDLEDDDWKEVAVSIRKTFLSLTKEITSLEQIKQLAQKMKQLSEFSKLPVEPDSYIIISNVLNSEIYCSGDIIVSGQGCLNTKIHAGGKLEIRGIMRGGEVYGKLGVEIHEAGAESGTTTIIAVPVGQTIKINKALEGTILKIGNVKHTLKENQDSIVARLDENNRMIFEKKA